MLTPRLELRGITKRFGASVALDSVDFTLEPGEIHALLGENGAGKSTLMNIGCGLLSPTSGQIRLGGELAAFASPREAARAGIGMVHQHFLLVPTFTVLENLILASQSQGWRLERDALASHAQGMASRLGWSVPLQARVCDLPVGTQQRIEILRALMGDARILLFDEPTAVLAPSEVGELLGVLRALRDEGRSLVFVSHKLSEVLALCDRVTVLRRGRLEGTLAAVDTDPKDLARRMVGDSAADALISDPFPQNYASSPSPNHAAPVLSVQSLCTKPAADAIALKNISFHIAPGEILGIAGVDGNGQEPLAEALTGLRSWSAGEIALHGVPITRLRPQDLEHFGIAFIPPDRQRQGLALDLTIEDNLVLEASQLPVFGRGPFLNKPALRAFAARTARDFDIRADSLQSPARALSGGNQQKIVIARALWRKPSLLIAVSPTRGLDVAATEYVHCKLRERQSEGGAVLLVSTELDEILALCDRIAVLYEGCIVGIVSAQTPRETLGLMMGGRERESA